MYVLRVKSDFAAAHYLRHYEGNCARLHGHTWTVEVEVEGEQLDGRGMLVDFRGLKGALRETLARLDHACLNDLSPFAGEAGLNNPTAENLARFLWDELENRVAPARLCLVRVWEAPDACAEYRGGAQE